MAAISKTIDRRDDHSQVTVGTRPARPAGIVPAAYFRWKGPLDRFAAVLLLIPGLPLIALLALLVRLTSPGPGIYRQERVGMGGRRFMMYKIRTMRRDAEAATGPVWTQTQDPRVTFLGKVLRKLHLDELPQLINVVSGDMALAGPRPERPEFVRVLSEVVPGYRNRLAVRPGITGLAQINLPPDTDLVSVQRKIVLDCEYIEKGGLWLDTRLMLCTFLRMFKISEAWLLRLLRLGRYVQIPGLPLTSTMAEDGAEAGQATPTAILLQVANLPDPAAPSPNGEKSDRAPHHGNGASHRNGNGNGKLSAHCADRSKPR